MGASTRVHTHTHTHTDKAQPLFKRHSSYSKGKRAIFKQTFHLYEVKAEC